MLHLEISSAMLTPLNAATALARFVSTTNTWTTRNMIVTTSVHELTRRALGLLGTMGLAALAFTSAPVQAAAGPPVIPQQPGNLTARPGDSARLSLETDGPSAPCTT